MPACNDKTFITYSNITIITLNAISKLGIIVGKNLVKVSTYSAKLLTKIAIHGTGPKKQ